MAPSIAAFLHLNVPPSTTRTQLLPDRIDRPTIQRLQYTTPPAWPPTSLARNSPPLDHLHQPQRCASINLAMHTNAAACPKPSSSANASSPCGHGSSVNPLGIAIRPSPGYTRRSASIAGRRSTGGEFWGRMGIRRSGSADSVAWRFGSFC